ncbi:MAG: 2OG-Fe(II) oxygenase [Chloroflexaceae bacterium]|nr:2OG-Fe(II) oxygenase [Chloroflexaceae bacterium]
MYKNSKGEVSIYTITVYLNDNYEGGSVKFMRSREDPTLLYTYKPKQGDALIFNHDVYHEGETLETNSKYLARTCLS